MAESNYDFPTEVITLPSEGKAYPESNPLSKGTVEIKYMTAKEEEILSSQNLIKKGVVLDKLFESIIVEKSINIDDILIGDKNAIMLATRILAYGPKYEVETYGNGDDRETVSIDLTSIRTKDIDSTKLKRDNRYEFTTPSGNKLVIKLLTHGDEGKIDADIKALSKFNKGGVSAELTTRYRYMIQSVDGKEDMKTITDFINNRFITRDTRAMREFIKEISPDVVMEYEYEDPETGEKEVRPIPMGVGFFTLPSNYSVQLHNQIFELCYYGNGFNQSEVYKLPVHLRNFYYKKLADAKKTENDSMKKQSNSVGKPKTPSKVRVNR